MDHQEGRSAADRLEQLESQVEALMGHVKALEYGLRLVIATHPAPELVLQALDSMADDILTPPSFTGEAASPMYQAALQQGLGIVREQITEALRSPP